MNCFPHIITEHLILLFFSGIQGGQDIGDEADDSTTACTSTSFRLASPSWSVAPFGIPSMIPSV